MATKISWTDDTWNPVTGCTKHSAGCDNCYAERMAPRLRGMANQNGKYRNGFEVTCHPEVLSKPQRSHVRRMFVNSMSDLFHKDVSLSFITQVFEVMGQVPAITFQILTKRAERLVELAPQLTWHPNVWMGVTIEADDYTFRADLLKQTAAAVKFVSLEPLLGPLPSLDVAGLDWVIVGGETGPGARPMLEPWVLDIRDRVVSAGIPFFFKQWGGRGNKTRGKMLQGKLWHQFP
ncbi:DUF5131 family protein [Fundidesulfovibrio soli]|uniref:DUF5131 family protein n=1 Tax=Fundidesulfovibrio soli TaxID=2922716 RepID=UPI001FAFEF87|nr:phage Gp37/Gp68 family protein [Fundidesulfovibrio soli]